MRQLDLPQYIQSLQQYGEILQQSTNVSIHVEAYSLYRMGRTYTVSTMSIIYCWRRANIPKIGEPMLSLLSKRSLKILVCKKEPISWVIHNWLIYGSWQSIGLKWGRSWHHKWQNRGNVQFTHVDPWTPTVGISILRDLWDYTNMFTHYWHSQEYDFVADYGRRYISNIHLLMLEPWTYTQQLRIYRYFGIR